MDMQLLKGNPFFLSDEDIAWVKFTLNSMTQAEKIGQLFCPVGFTTKEKDLLHLTQDVGVGGIMYRPAPGADALKTHRFLQDHSKIPMLLAANLEQGGSGAASDGTLFAMPMGAAAANDKDMGYHLGDIACTEGAAIGLNWSFAPIVDIDMNCQNPITNLRTFGSDPDKVIQMAKGYMKAADEHQMAVSIKHFPGDGVDYRDQHLLTSVNSLSAKQWDSTYGKVYQELINFGAKTVMVGHIAQPAYEEALAPGDRKNKLVPATLSKALMTGLLRGKLGFNGVISTDATPMLGYTVAMARKDAVPYSIACGADIFLFNRNFDEDFKFMTEGVQKGVITKERLNDAVTRILALKASLKLHEKKKNNTLVPPAAGLSVLKCEKHLTLAKECADKAVTLVKDTQNLLPISAKKTPRVYLNVLQDDDDIHSATREAFKTRLEKEGFTVSVRDRTSLNAMAALISESKMSFIKKMTAIPKAMKAMSEMTKENLPDLFDLAIFVGYFPTASNNTTIRIQWRGVAGMGNDSPWFVSELPALFISLANPYHLQDVPMIKTYINAYTNNTQTIDAVMEKIMGRSEFKGVSPVDASCGREDNMY